MKYSGKIHIVYDGMWGSCGKGKFCGELARDNKLDIKICVNNNAPNAGHTFVFDDGRKIITKHIPIGFVNKNIPYLVIGESAVIDYDRLVYEIQEYGDILDGRKIYIADTAAIVLPEHKQKEIEQLRTGSTFSGAGAALVDKITRKSVLVRGDERFRKLEEQGFIKIIPSKLFFPMVYGGLGPFKGNENILIELSQGDALSINSDNYPHTTSRDCTPAQALKDIHATDYSDRVKKYCIFRPYPIRINNQTSMGEIYTGDFAGANEITWDNVCQRSGLNVDEIKRNEHTTVTKRLRRVAEFSIKQFSEMLLDTKPDECFLNFAEYINANITELSTQDAIKVQKTFVNGVEEKWEDSAAKNFAIENVLGYVKDMEYYFNNLLKGDYLKITRIGTGAKECQTILRSKISQVARVNHAVKHTNAFDFSDKTNVPNFNL